MSSHKHDENSKYSNNCRYYFTSARVEQLTEKVEEHEEVKVLQDQLKHAAKLLSISEGQLLLKYVCELREVTEQQASYVEHFEQFLEQTVEAYQDQYNKNQNTEEISHSKKSMRLQAVVAKFHQNGGKTEDNSIEQELVEDDEEQVSEPNRYTPNMQQNAALDSKRITSSQMQSREYQQKGVKHKFEKAKNQSQPNSLSELCAVKQRSSLLGLVQQIRTFFAENSLS